MIRNFKIPLIIIFASNLILLGLFYAQIISLISLKSQLLGLGIAVLNFILFIISYSLGVGKANKVFLIFTMGGIGVRLFFSLLLVVLVLLFLNIDQYGFIFAFFVWYVLLMIFEINLVRSKFSLDK